MLDTATKRRIDTARDNPRRQGARSQKPSGADYHRAHLQVYGRHRRRERGVGGGSARSLPANLPAMDGLS